MEIIKAANKVIREGIALLPDEAKSDFKAMRSDIFIDEAIANAMGATNENEERIALLKAYAIQEANRVASTVWRLVPPVPEEFEKEFRALPSMKEVADAYNVFTDDRKARMDKVMAAHKVIADEEGELDIFKGIINGISAKDAAKEYEDFKKKQQQAMGAK